MMARVLEEEGEFGIVWVADDGLRPVGCACEIAEVLERMPDGRLNLVARGTRAFRIEARQEELAYPAGTVEFLDDRDEELDAAAAEEAHAVYAELVDGGDRPHARPGRDRRDERVRDGGHRRVRPRGQAGTARPALGERAAAARHAPAARGDQAAGLRRARADAGPLQRQGQLRRLRASAQQREHGGRLVGLARSRAPSRPARCAAPGRRRGAAAAPRAHRRRAARRRAAPCSRAAGAHRGPRRPRAGAGRWRRRGPRRPSAAGARASRSPRRRSGSRRRRAARGSRPRRPGRPRSAARRSRPRRARRPRRAPPPAPGDARRIAGLRRLDQRHDATLHESGEAGERGSRAIPTGPRRTIRQRDARPPMCAGAP